EGELLRRRGVLLGVDPDGGRGLGADGFGEGDAGDLLVAVGGLAIEDGLGGFGAGVKNVGQRAAAVVEAGIGGIERGAGGLESFLGGGEAFLGGEEPVVSAGDAEGDFLVGL